VTYGELAVRVDRTAAALQSLGLGPGDVVTIQLPNWVEFAYVFFACERIGAIANQIGPDFRSRSASTGATSRCCNPSWPARAPCCWTASAVARRWS